MVLIYQEAIKWLYATFERCCWKAKKDLSGVSQTQISLPFISAGAAGPLHLEVALTRAKIWSINSWFN